MRIDTSVKLTAAAIGVVLVLALPMVALYAVGGRLGVIIYLVAIGLCGIARYRSRGQV